MAGYNTLRSVHELLAQHESSPPSFTVHLYPEYWTLNNGSKFLYNNQVASLLDDIRAQRIPADFLELFDSSGLPFYDGCMIVELLDYRPPKAKDPVLVDPERSRVVLAPNGETLWADICLLNQKSGYTWTDQDALEVEARILVATAPPLCLDPDPHLTRVVNNIHRVSMPKTPPSLKRKAAAVEQEEEEAEKARRIKISQYMNPRNNRSNGASFRILDLLERVRNGKTASASPKPEAAKVPAAPSVANSVPEGGINPALIALKPGQAPAAAGMPAILPAPGVPAPPTALSLPNGQERKVMRQSPRPPSTAPVPATAIPPHMQMYSAARNTPPPPSHIPRPPSSVAAHAQSSPIMRPPSVAHQQPQAGPSVPHQASPQVQPAQPPQAQPQQPQQQIPTPSDLTSHQALIAFMTQKTPAQRQQFFKSLNPQQQMQFQAALKSHQMQVQAQQARKNGNATPAQNASPTAQAAHAQGMQQPQQPQQPQPLQQPQQPTPQQQALQQAQQAAQQAAQQRNSPHHVNQPLAARSPMPANAQAVPQMAQGYPYAAMAQAQSQYNPAHLRPVVPGHPHMMSHLANGGAQAGAMLAQGQPGQPTPEQAAQAQQQQQQQQQHAAAAMMPPGYAMYNYAQMGMNMQHGRVPQYQWPVNMGRGVAPANMLQQHAQQMQMGTGKTVPGGMQGT